MCHHVSLCVITCVLISSFRLAAQVDFLHFLAQIYSSRLSFLASAPPLISGTPASTSATSMIVIIIASASDIVFLPHRPFSVAVIGVATAKLWICYNYFSPVGRTSRGLTLIFSW